MLNSENKLNAFLEVKQTYAMARNGRRMMKCKCAECGITKGLLNLGRIGASQAIKSDFAKKKMKEVGEKYLGQVTDSVTSDLSKRIDPRTGKGLDIHKAIGKPPKPESGWTLPGHNFTGPYNDLDKQVKYDKKTGEIFEVYQQPTGATDAIAMQHDVHDYAVCGDDKKCKHQADKKMVQALDAVPWNERQWGHWLTRNTVQTKRKLGLGANAKKNAQNLSWQEKLADELHKPIKRDFLKRRLISPQVDEIWCSDLIDMQKLSKWDKGYKYLLMVLDIFSKYGWIVPLKTKTGLEVSKALESIFRENKPKMLWVDKGKEYYNKNVLDLLAKNKIEIYSTENEEKSSVCERSNRTIKTKMYKQFTVQNNTVYIDILPKILSSYSNSKHRSIGMTPNQARKQENYGKASLFQFVWRLRKSWKTCLCHR